MVLGVGRKEILTEVLLEERVGIAREREPLFLAIPFARGLLADPSEFGIEDANGGELEVQSRVAARWPDGSVQWLHCDFHGSVPASETVRYFAFRQPPSDAPARRAAAMAPLRLIPSEKGIDIDTGIVRARLANTGEFRPWDVSLHGDGGTPGATVALTVPGAGSCRAFVDRVEIETSGPLKSTVRSDGCFRSAADCLPVRFRARHHFFAGSGVSRLEFTIHNPQAAKHRQSLWDLGDERSFFFTDLSLLFPSDRHAASTEWKTGMRETFRRAHGAWELFQGSSGGPNWQSSNHVNRDGAIPVRVPGCRISSGGATETIDRATPTCRLLARDVSVTITVREFWQNFPKAIRGDEAGLFVQLFPAQFGDAFELQPGEQKGHVLYLQFGRATDSPDLDWSHAPVVPKLPAEWYARTGIHPYLTPPSASDCQEYACIVAGAMEGPTSFFAKRDVIDEYGWRNFGEVYADHESRRQEADRPLTSHYNNQYDLLYGAILHYWRSGDRRWFQFADELARHVRDIDIYHTTRDRFDFNGGLFWHTSHYVDAATATHRCFSRAHAGQPGAAYGGGPSAAHCYATGLVHHYLITGDAESLDSANELVNYAKGLLVGPSAAGERLTSCVRRMARAVRRRVRKRPETNPLSWPTRSSANVLTALLDGYQISRRDEYLQLADTFVRQCASPADDPDAMRLLDAEVNWSYLMFLQAVGRFLDVLADTNGRQSGRDYAAAVLLRYARWIAACEKPFLDQAEALEYPTETWAATELRKVNVLLLAFKHAEPNPVFLDRARFFHRRCFEDLRGFGEKAGYARPLAILLTNGLMFEYFKSSGHVQYIS